MANKEPRNVGDAGVRSDVDQELAIRRTDTELQLFNPVTGEIVAVKTIETVEEELGFSITGTVKCIDVVGEPIIIWGKLKELKSAFPTQYEGQSDYFSLYQMNKIPAEGRAPVAQLLVVSGVLQNQLEVLTEANPYTIVRLERKESGTQAGFHYFTVAPALLTDEDVKRLNEAFAAKSVAETVA